MPTPIEDIEEIVSKLPPPGEDAQLSSAISLYGTWQLSSMEPPPQKPLLIRP